MLESYVELHRTRYGSRLHVEVDIDRSLLDALVPPLVLQPLVENALRHGLEPRRGGGTVRVAVTARGPRLAVSIADNGVGLPKQFIEGVGLRNTRTRLRELYGDDQAFVVFAPPSGGTEARLEIPLRRDIAREAPRA